MKPRPLPPGLSDLERDAWVMLMANGFPEPETEWKFHKHRRWRLDLAWPEVKIALEVEGGTWMYGRHQTPKGFAADCEKYSVAAAMGWTVIRATADQVRDGSFLEWLKLTGARIEWLDEPRATT